LDHAAADHRAWPEAVRCAKVLTVSLRLATPKVAVQLAHAAGKVRLRRLGEQVVTRMAGALLHNRHRCNIRDLTPRPTDAASGA